MVSEWQCEWHVILESRSLHELETNRSALWCSNKDSGEHHHHKYERTYVPLDLQTTQWREYPWRRVLILQSDRRLDYLPPWLVVAHDWYHQTVSQLQRHQSWGPFESPFESSLDLLQRHQQPSMKERGPEGGSMIVESSWSSRSKDSYSTTVTTTTATRFVMRWSFLRIWVWGSHTYSRFGIFLQERESSNGRWELHKITPFYPFAWFKFPTITFWLNFLDTNWSNNKISSHHDDDNRRSLS